MSKRLLVVDDDALFRQMLVEILETQGYEVFPARNGVEGFEVFQKTPHLDVVITDIRMPKKNGFELTRDIHEVAPETPIILISGWYDPLREIPGREVALALRRNDSPYIRFLKKPFRISQLMGVIKEFTHSQRRAGAA